ncbi:NADP(H)-dependent aldo-keto reductase [Pantanalinema rosaneae CENA516]|uniref:NADP(H)-dependent aldo-keto reductase n=1 Tax=Pantanalinema rosaneae TaxID=1620701 RepID=UPI003D6DD45B
MQYRQLGDSALNVSELCLGTMTFGQQTTIAEAHQQLDYAIAAGVNFIDAAEMYPVPAKAETSGLTESYIGQWLAQQPRDRLIIATKIAGPSRGMNWMRQGQRQIDRVNIDQAVNASLKRLRTDYIDLYQIHWPDRYVPLFGQTSYDPKQIRDTVPIVEQLSAFADLIHAGKIRYIGLSNETPWGVMEFCHAAKQCGLPKIVSIQNAYNLLNRSFEWGLAEACRHEHISLLAYSPLGFGNLTGKYLQNPPPNSRMTLFPGFGQRYLKPNVNEAVADYVNLAQQYDLSPVALALAFVQQRWFVSSTIVGASTLDQLKQNLDSVHVTLTEEILTAIDRIHSRYPNPAP